MSDSVSVHPCSKCGARLKFPAGKARLKCPKCQTLVLAAPAPSAAVTPVPTARATVADEIPVVHAVSAAPPAPRLVSPPTVEPLPTEATDPIPASTPGWGRILIGSAAAVGGLCLGGLATVALSAAKPQIGMLGLAACLVLVGLLGFVLLVVCGVARLTETFASGRLAGVAAYLRRWSFAALLFTGCGFLVCAVLVGVEAFGPPEGHVRKYLADRAERQRQDDVAAKKAEEKMAQDKFRADDLAAKVARDAEKMAWGGADFVVVNPAHRAVAVRNDGTRKAPRYTVVAKATDGQTRDPLLRAWDAKVPVLANEPALARRLFERYNAGQAIDTTDTQALARFAGFRPLLPMNAQLVAFQDPTASRRRVGHLIKDTGAGIVFCDLVPKPNPTAADGDPPDRLFATEFIARPDRTTPISLTKLTDDALRQSADPLEHLPYFIMSRLQQELAGGDGPVVRPAIYVDEMYPERQLEDGILASLRQDVSKLRRAKRTELQEILTPTGGRETSGSGKLGVLVATMLIVANDMKEQAIKRGLAADVKRDYDAEIKILEEKLAVLKPLVETGHFVTRDVRKRLVDAGLTIPDPSKRAHDLFRKMNGKDWIRPTAEVAVDDNLIQATHLLLTELDKPQAGGSYHISMRLVDVRTGKILWMDHGDRTVPGLVLFPPPPKPYDFNGLWRSEGNKVTLRIKSTDTTLTASLHGSHKLLSGFELRAKRKHDDLIVESCFMIFHADETFQYPVDLSKVTIKKVGDAIEIATPEATETRGVSIPSGKRVSFGFGVQKNVYTRPRRPE